MAIYKSSFFIINEQNKIIYTPITDETMDADIETINNDLGDGEFTQWHLARCKEDSPSGDPDYVRGQKYEIYVKYDKDKNAVKVAAPCPPFCIGNSGV